MSDTHERKCVHDVHERRFVSRLFHYIMHGQEMKEWDYGMNIHERRRKRLYYRSSTMYARIGHICFHYCNPRLQPSFDAYIVQYREIEPNDDLADCVDLEESVRQRFISRSFLLLSSASKAPLSIAVIQNRQAQYLSH